jgi:hypothetical protein
MENQSLSTRLLDTAIKAMERNRALLFTINLIAALIFVIVYLDRYSFDMQQGKGHLIAYQGHCEKLSGKLRQLPGWSQIPPEEVRFFDGCADLNRIRGFITANIKDSSTLAEVSEPMYRLHIIQNEMGSIRLPAGSMTPLGIGLPTPRNDMIIICGVLLVILYIWLAFSFEQLARVTAKITTLFPERDSEKGDTPRATVSDLVELNFLFRTSKGGAAKILVKGLYLLAPIAMSVATVNDLYPETTRSYQEYLKSILQVPLMVQAMMVIVLWIVSYDINNSDGNVNAAAAE